MKKQIITFAVIFTMVLLMVSCGNGCDGKSGENANETVEATKYQCPMKCEGDKVYAEAGACPVCEMDLELVQSETDHDGHEH